MVLPLHLLFKASFMGLKLTHDFPLEKGAVLGRNHNRRFSTLRLHRPRIGDRGPRIAETAEKHGRSQFRESIMGGAGSPAPSAQLLLILVV